jgi:hypothetical protein
MPLKFLFFVFALTLCSRKGFASDDFKPRLYSIIDSTNHRVAGYIFGTQHLFVNVNDIPWKFWYYFKNSSAYAFENSIGTSESSADTWYLDRRSQKTSESKSLNQLLNPQELKMLKLYLKDLPPQRQKNFIEDKSAFGALVFINKKLMHEYIDQKFKAIGFSQNQTLDNEFRDHVDSNKTIYALDQPILEYFDCIYLTNKEKILKNLHKILRKNYLNSILAA